MIVEITVPYWGLEMEEATVKEWIRRVGDQFDKGAPVVILETDKAEGDVEAEVAGRLIEIVADVGFVVKPGDLLARIETKE